MSNFNLDEFAQQTVTIKGKEYELKVPTLDQAGEFSAIFDKLSKIKESKEDPGGWLQLAKILAEKAFVTPPTDEVMRSLTPPQVYQLLAHISQLFLSGKTQAADKKK